MFWVIVVAMAVVVGGAALVALGGGGSLPEAVHDRLAVRLPQERPLAKADVDEIRLPMAVRGYRMDEVDDVLDRLGAELAYRDSRIAELEAAIAVSEGVQAGAGQAVAPAPGSEPLPGLEAFAGMTFTKEAEAGAPDATANLAKVPEDRVPEAPEQSDGPEHA